MTKDIGVTYLCWLFGVHYLYLGKPFIWIVYILTIGGFGLWALIDLFRIPGLVKMYNLQHTPEYNQLQKEIYG